MGIARPDTQLQRIYMDINPSKKQAHMSDDSIIFSGCTETFQHIMNQYF